MRYLCSQKKFLRSFCLAKKLFVGEDGQLGRPPPLVLTFFYKNCRNFIQKFNIITILLLMFFLIILYIVLDLDC